MLRSGHMSLIEETQRINKIQLTLEDKYIIMSKEISELKKEIRDIHKSRQESIEFNKHITVRNFPDINQPRLNERLETVINEDIELTNNKVVNMNILSKDTSNKGVVMVELESIDIKHKIMKQKHLLRKKQYNPPIYIHTAKSRMEYKMEVNTKKLFNMIPGAHKSFRISENGHINKLTDHQKRQTNRQNTHSNNYNDSRKQKKNNSIQPLSVSISSKTDSQTKRSNQTSP